MKYDNHNPQVQQVIDDNVGQTVTVQISGQVRFTFTGCLNKCVGEDPQWLVSTANREGSLELVFTLESVTKVYAAPGGCVSIYLRSL